MGVDAWVPGGLLRLNPAFEYVEPPSSWPLSRAAYLTLAPNTRAPAPSTLCHALNLDWRFISHVIIYMFQCHSPISSHPRALPQSPKDCSIYLCLFCGLSYRVIITIFLNSIYMRYYTVLVFFFLVYFTLYNRLQFHNWVTELNWRSCLSAQSGV